MAVTQTPPTSALTRTSIAPQSQMILQEGEDPASALQRMSMSMPMPMSQRDGTRIRGQSSRAQVEELDQPPPYHTLSALPDPGPSRNHPLPPLPPRSSQLSQAVGRSVIAPSPPPREKRPATLVVLEPPPAPLLRAPSPVITSSTRTRTVSAPQRTRNAATVASRSSVPASAPPRAATSTLPSGAHAKPRPPLLDAPVINGIFISTRDEPISGSWRIDPDVRMLAPAPKPKSSSQANSYRPRRARKAMAAEPNAAFDTRGGAINVQLGVVGRPLARGEGRKASVRVTTRNGAVKLDVKVKSPGRYLDLDVYSKRGNSFVLLPKSFSGVIELHSRKGKLEVLQALAHRARVLKSTDEEILLIVGQGDTSQLADYVRYTSRAGTLRVGYTEEDDRPEPVIGFWKKLGRMLVRRENAKAVENVITNKGKA